VQRTVEKAPAREKLCVGVFEIGDFQIPLLFSDFWSNLLRGFLGWEGYGS